MSQEEIIEIAIPQTVNFPFNLNPQVIYIDVFEESEGKRIKHTVEFRERLVIEAVSGEAHREWEFSKFLDV